MNTFPYDSSRATSEKEAPVVALYHDLLTAWNEQNANVFAALFDETGLTIGFDGSVMEGPQETKTTLGAIFADHPTATYVAKVRDVWFLSPTSAVLRAITGLIPRGGSDINPATNAHQTLIANKIEDQWRIVLFQNTPAQFHGRPEVSQAFTEELRALLH